MKVYIAGPLFNDAERSLNAEIRDLLHSWRFATFLPQEDGGIAFDEIQQGGSAREVRHRIFKRDIEEITKSNIFLAILDGRVPDEGMCVELGIAYTLKKHCVGYKTDARTMDEFGENVMIEGCLNAVVHNYAQLKKHLLSIR